MAVTTLDPKTALIVIDLQNGIVALPTVHPAGEVVKYASALADAFVGMACRSCSLVSLVRHRAGRNGLAVLPNFPPDGPILSLR
jgi:hypothetical protein